MAVVQVRVVALLLASLALAGPAHAEEVDDPLLAALVEEALARNPELRAAEQTVLAARARPEQARALPEPMLSLAYTNDGWAPSLGERDMTTLALMWSQALPFPGKRALRGAIREREADQVEQQAARVRLGVVAAVKRSYVGLLQARDLLRLTREQAELWRQTEGVARARYVVGQGAQQDVLRTQVEVTRIEQLLAEQSAEEEVRQAELNSLLDRPPDASLETPRGLALRPLERANPDVLEWVRGVSPELAATRAAVERERLAVTLARKDFKPDFTVQGGYMNRGGLDPMWQAGVGVTLPIYRKKLGAALAEAEAGLRAGEGRVHAVELQLRYRTQERLAQIRTAQRVAELYEKGIVPQDRMSVEAAIANYQAGKVPFVAVLEALATLYGDRSTHVGLLAAHARALASLEEASLEPTSDLPAMEAPGTAARGRGGATTPASGGMGSR